MKHIENTKPFIGHEDLDKQEIEQLKQELKEKHIENLKFTKITVEQVSEAKIRLLILKLKTWINKNKQGQEVWSEKDHEYYDTDIILADSLLTYLLSL